MTLADPRAAVAAANRLSDAPRSVARVERVPARRLIAGRSGGAADAWHIARIGADRARAQAGYDDGAHVTLATIDSGVDAGHPMIAAAIGRYTSSYPGGPASAARDLIAHGTHVAGIISARGGVDGVCRSRLRILKAFHDEVDRYQPLRRPDGRWFFASQSAPDERMYVLALAACLDEDVPVINLSLGYEQVHSREQAIFAGYAHGRQTVVAAVGNDGPGGPELYPARYDSAIAVGALTRDDRTAGFSTPTSYVLVSAPGVDIPGTMPTYAGATEFEGSVDAGGVLVRGAAIPWSTNTGAMSGTSSAAPQVSAAAALWIARNGRDPGRLRDRIAATARRLPEMGGADRTDSHGHGCLDVAALLA